MLIIYFEVEGHYVLMTYLEEGVEGHYVLMTYLEEEEVEYH